MIQIEKVTKSFNERKVLDNVSLSIENGECVFILGKSGVGKSVLLKAIVGLIEIDCGSITVGGLKVDPTSQETLSQVRKGCGLVFQFSALLDSVNVFENICFGLRARGLKFSEENLSRLVKDKLAITGLSEAVLERYPTELSFGAQKRVSIARALAVEPNYLLFDEPTTGMDPIAIQGINRLIIELSTQLKVTTVVVSHDIKSALEVGKRIVLLEHGRVVFDGKPENFKNSTVPLAREFQLGL